VIEEEAEEALELERKKGESIKTDSSVLVYHPSEIDPSLTAFGQYGSIRLVKGQDPYPELRFMHEQDHFVFDLAKAKYIEKYKLKWDEKMRIYPEFLEHANKHIHDFRSIYEHEEYDENYANKSAMEKQEIYHIAKGIQFYYLDDIGRFTLKITHPKIKYVSLSDQICYVIGYEPNSPILNGQIAKYMVDLHGGVSHLCIYLNSGLIVCLSFFN
jgi:hypothetical protein